MIRKVISGGQAGVERAALDVALKFMIECGGWIPDWRAREDEDLVKTYRMTVLEGANYVQATERNVTAGDGVMVVSRGEVSGSAALHIRLAERHNRPLLLLDVERTAAFEAARKAESWIREHGIQVLTVTGSPPGGEPDIHHTASGILEALYHLLVIDPQRYLDGAMGLAPPADRLLESLVRIPKTVDEAVAALQSALSFHDRSRIAKMAENRLDILIPSLGMYVKNEFRLWQGNPPLEADCRARSARADEEPSTVILRALWKALQVSDQVLRVVK
ncbi:YpsA SLOG family protein [Desulfococcus sp.]|uniref:YpsA SLOG family protein n=1 Tax=Desulfococcus sp. TaxID=2025834 RepID=UPI003594612A